MTLKDKALDLGWAYLGNGGNLVFSDGVSTSDVWDEAIKACAALCDAQEADKTNSRDERYMAGQLSAAIHALAAIDKQ